MFLDSAEGVVERGGYVTDLITDDCIDWLDRRDPKRPFAMFCHHKASHRSWEPHAKHFTMYEDIEIPYPKTFRDDLAGRAEVVQAVKMRMLDLDPIVDLKSTVPSGLTLDDVAIDWRYQRYIKDYLHVVASMDTNIGRLLDSLDERDLTDNTIVVYTSDQGFFLGDHGWFDKRPMYEESLAMPLLIRYPPAIAAGTTSDDIVVNVDFEPTLLDLCGLDVPDHVQGRSFAPTMRGETPDYWPELMYYRYSMHNDGDHACPAHYGVRTRTHKLIRYYNDPLDQPEARCPSNPIEWELFDLVADPLETDNLSGKPGTEAITA